LLEIEKIENISYEDFMREFYNPCKPVVLKNASKAWAARDIFNPDWFRNHYGERRTVINGITYTMREVMDMAENSNVEIPAPYPSIFNIMQVLPEILTYLNSLDLLYAKPNWLETVWFKKGHWGDVKELFIGGAGGKFPYIHLDYYHLNAWITQLYGEKMFTIFPPGQEYMLYPLKNDPWRSEIDIYNPDFKRFPNFKNATPVSVKLAPGETLFIPAGTWHTAYSLTLTISVAFDQLNEKNHKDFLKDVWFFKKREGTIKAVVKYGYAWMASQVCKLENRLHHKN
jgi:histone arginine demethylase JMJD6